MNGHRFIRCSFACVILLAFSVPAIAAQPDDCTLTFRGRSRKAVKLRPASLKDTYTPTGTSDAPLTPEVWFTKICDWQTRVPDPVPETTAIPAIEEQVVTMDAFIMAVRFENFPIVGDRDFHVELAASPDWSAGPHLIVEVPPGPEYCDARKAVWQLVKSDAGTATPPKTHFFRNPPKVRVAGFVFFDATHATTDCRDNGGRGIRDSTHPGMVEGVFELHPVISVIPQ